MNGAPLENDFGERMGTHPNSSSPVYPTNQNYQNASQTEQQPIIMQPTNLSKGRSPLEFEQKIMEPGPGFCEGKETSSSLVGNVPRGLEYLASIDQLLVRQKRLKFREALGGDTSNKYKIYDSGEREIFDTKEDAGFWMKSNFGPSRPFDMIIKDWTGQEVIQLTRPLTGTYCCSAPLYHKALEVYAPPGNFVGSVEQEAWSFCAWTPKFLVKDSQGETVLHIKCLAVSCCADFEFNVLSLDKSIEVGKISKQWPKLTRELFKDPNNFSLSFPIDLDVKMKAVLIGACMLIDFIYFKLKRSNNN